MITIFCIITLMMILSPTCVSAQEVDTTYKGEYSISYLLKNYNLVSFEKNNNFRLDFFETQYLIKNNTNFEIEGPVLINGDYTNKDETNISYSKNNPNKVVSFINGTKGENITTASQTSSNKNFINFDKLYNQVLTESKSLANQTEYKINKKDIQITKPGIYEINNTRMLNYEVVHEYRIDPIAETYIIHENEYESFDTNLKYIYIDNYNPDNYYIFNNMKTYEIENYVVLLRKKGENIFSPIDEYSKKEKYTGNIIFNYPNAKALYLVAQSGKVIAPQADVYLADAAYYYYYNYGANTIHDSIYANSITGMKTPNYENLETYPKLSFYPYTSTKEIIINEIKVEEIKDYSDDLYTGTYTIQEMLENYNLVTLGQKEYDRNTMFYQNDEERNGSAYIFHIAGQFLVNGTLYAYRIDLESNKIKESSCNNCNIDNEYKSWGDGDTRAGTNSVVFQKSTGADARTMNIYSKTDYINFNRLYNNIIKEQKQILKGDKISSNNSVVHIKTGGNYYIENINDIEEIVFDEFEQNNKKLTVITILGDKEINFPKISQKNKGNYIPTKDYLGKEEPMFAYEYFNFPDDIYTGNIIWNIPNANYIKLADNAPFIGHIVAPNADLETSETHFAGSFIVNSLYSEGNTEAHFYPLQFQEIPDDFNTLKSKLELEIITEKNNENKNEAITNPNTIDSYKLVLIIGLISIISYFSYKYLQKRENKYD